MFKVIRKCLTVVSICILITISPLALGTPNSGLFSDKNFSALKNNSADLLSSVNACRLKKLLGPNHYNLFNQAMSLTTTEEDAENYLSISGGARGLFTIFEGFYRMSRDGKIWLAYLYDNQVHYFTNDTSSLKTPPKIMQDWSSRFKEAKWVPQLIKIESDNCK